jgi:hypothetical protein
LPFLAVFARQTGAASNVVAANHWLHPVWA